MRRGLTFLPVLIASAFLAAGCGGSSSDSSAREEAGQVAVAYVKAMWHLDFPAACAIEFTNRHGRPYQGKSETDKKRGCVVGWRHYRPLDQGAPGPGELGTTKRFFGLPHADVQSVGITGDSASVTVRDPHTGDERELRTIRQDGRWLVYDEEIGPELGG